MCTTCGCSTHKARIFGVPDTSHRRTETRLNYRPIPSQPVQEPEAITLPATHASGMNAKRILRIERDILTLNDAQARQNRDFFSKQRILVLNLLSSPGSGKTTLLVKTIKTLRNKLPIAVIEGDQQTDRDAARIRATGVPVIQINTGKGCHLDAHMVNRAIERLPLQDGGLLFIENVGNLVCPASFDLGETHKVVMLSVTEGEDKPLKYPDMFQVADLLLLNKCDLLPYVDFNTNQAVQYAHRIHPGLPVISLSATLGDGMATWLHWIETARQAAAVESVSDTSNTVLQLG